MTRHQDTPTIADTGTVLGTLYCSFCGKSQHEVCVLIAGVNAFICDECTDLCVEIVKEKQAEKRPGRFERDKANDEPIVESGWWGETYTIALGRAPGRGDGAITVHVGPSFVTLSPAEAGRLSADIAHIIAPAEKCAAL